MHTTKIIVEIKLLTKEIILDTDLAFVLLKPHLLIKKESKEIPKTGRKKHKK